MKKLLLASLCFLLLCLTQVYAQNRTVTGTVTAKDDGLPIPGVSVKVKGSSSGTQTNAAGKFSLSVPSGATLTFSFIGYNSQEVAIGTKGTYDVVLASANSQLNEVVVTALGITRQASSLGYSTAKVSGKEITQAKPISVINGLTGKVSGLQVNTVNNGLFAPTRVTLRGNRSLLGNNQPLYVVDGAIFYSDISTINPEDIADVNVLKGSSASAVYGSDASNGVIVITTKHGSKGSTSLTVSSTIQVEKVSYMPTYQTRFGANGGEREVLDFTNLSYYIPYENQSYGPEYDGRIVPLGRPAQDGSIEMVPYAAVKNQKKDFFDTGITTQNNFSFNSGDDKGGFYMSGQDIHSKGIMPKDEGRREIFRVGGDKKYGIFSATYSATYTFKNTNQTNTGSVYNDLIEAPTNIPVADLKDPTSKYGTPDAYANDYYLSPGQIIAQQRNLTTENHIQANLQLNLKVAPWLNLSYRTAVDNSTTKYEYKDAGINYSAFTDTAQTVYYSDNNGGITKARDAGAKATSTTNPLPNYGTYDLNNILYSSDFLAAFNVKLPSDFKLYGTAGISYLDNKITLNAVAAGPLNFTPYNTQNFASVPQLITGVYEARKIGYFGEATVGYKDYAFVHGSYRTDLDTRLSKANKYIPYYDIDGSLVLSEMFKELANNDYLNYVKVRYAHSLTGNASALANGSQYIAYGAYATIPTVSLTSGFPYSASGISGYSLNTRIANPNIKPEKVTEDEVGLDLGFLKDRITLGASAYKSQTKDGIVTAQISRASGFTSALLNAANTQNKGLELDLKGNIIQSQAVTWRLGVNYTKQSSKVISIVSGVKELQIGTSVNTEGLLVSSSNQSTYAIVGQPYPSIKGYDWNRDPATGKVIVDANTGLPTRAAAQTNLGNATPTDLLGFTSSLTYKGFTLNITVDYRGGYKIFNQIGNTQDHSGVGVTTTLAGRQRFVFPNSVYKDANGNYVDNTNILTQDGNYNFFPTTWLGVDANYIMSAAAWKLREASLAYAFPKAWLRDVKFVKGVNVSVSGRNLLMFRPSTNKFSDPEFSEDTSNAVGRTSVNQVPPTRIISGTLAVTF
ncbi:SusC/RagA family TonB-linked outer membrane protein [Mucilaginibacter sp. FT3.2]|uniref:SusC/RagA family TonB-linked outer membrane protein n=1 Tax=Mucilaginibacter sp. FT3.2 TaxID=2723090 RepID=UPI00160F29F2|nr:SusC/RagA family TonB-linked outer membrane protein [Mucilaginibacter sp. FT3.2]MBB6230832.1 TonB-linked SusC/RagA family outer membrane protein [Mucilaginibacter sp. FT3.2]